MIAAIRLLALLLWLQGCALPTAAPGRDPDPTRDMVVTIFGEDTTAFRAIAAEYGLELVATWPIRLLGVGCAVLRAAAPELVPTLMQRLAADPRVETVQRLQVFETAAPRHAPLWDDPFRPAQAEAQALDLDGAHRLATGRGVLVAVLDTGIDATHEDLFARVVGTADVVGLAAGPERHGTAMAGLIAATGGNGRGVVGVAPGASLLGVRACWETARGGQCSTFTLARGLAAAIAARPAVLNLSLSGPADPLLTRLGAAALEAGVIVVAAGGPSGFAAALPGAIRAVPADGPADAGAIRMPAAGSLTTVPGGYDVVAGFSVAAAQVSGLIALLREVAPGLTAADAAGALRSAALPDACRAVAALARRVADACRADAAENAPRG